MKFNVYSRFLLCLLITIIHSSAIAQQQQHIFEWATYFKHSNTWGGESEGRAITTDNQGNVYTSGIFEGTVNFDPNNSNGYYLGASTNPGQIFFQKMDAQGNFIWAKKLDYFLFCSVKKMVTDASNNLYIVGEFVGSGDFNPGLGTNNLNAVGLSDIFILKLDENGNYVWAKQIGGVYNDYIESITVDGQGNIYTIGEFKGTVDFLPGAGTFNLTTTGLYDVFIQKFNPDGSFAWVKSFGGIIDDYGYDIATDAQGNVYSTGYFRNTVDFDTDSSVYNLTSINNTTDIFVHKLSANGNFLWAKQMEGTSDEKGYSIAVDTQNNVYLTGVFGGGMFGGTSSATVDFDPDSSVYNLTAAINTRDIFVQKLNTNGNLVWVKQLFCTDSEAISIVLDQAGNSHILGMFSGNINLDPLGSSTIFISAGFDDIFLQKLDVNGNFVWGKQLGNIKNDNGNSLAIGKGNSLYTTGQFDGTLDFDSDVGVYNLTGDNACFVLKLRALNQNDLGVSSIHLSCDPNLIFKIQNYGYNTVDSFEIGWSVNSVIQSPIMVYSTIMSLDSALVVGTYSFDNGQTYQIDAWINSVNDALDGLIFNDSTSANLTPPFAIEILDTFITDVYFFMFGSVEITPSGDPSIFQYLWSRGDTTQNLMDIDLPGYYYLTITDAAGCQDTFSFEVGYVNTNFVLNHQRINVRLYPNPIHSNQLINIEFDAILDDNINYQLVNIDGKIMSNGNLSKQKLQHQIKTPEQAGMYYLQLILDNQIVKVIPFLVE